MAKQSVTAIILIAVGTLLFLNQLDLIYLSSGDYFIYGAIIGGILWFINGMNRTDKKGVFAGTFFASYGIVLWLMKNYYLFRSDELGFAALFLCLALANFVYITFKRESTNNLIFGGIFALIGGAFLISHLDVYPMWRLYYHIDHYWPVLLIVLGLFLLFKSIRKKEPTSVEQI